jgi:hypothetical protein
MRRDYDFTKGVRGKYASRLKPGSQIVVLDPMSPPPSATPRR